MYVVISKFAVEENSAEDVRTAFRERPHEVDNAPGFIKLDVLNPVQDPGEFWLLTYWDDEKSFQEWYNSHKYKESHEQMPRGLKVLNNSTDILHFNHITS